ncbi:class I SAM-dependent methyltransferase [Polymorphospora sp. NPDC051019]|uniref:class I SAM-dependent methyltransferase n=1 Tax=Polymorphospora sp. NPDC051019 TaxID=3155725 RepID=UPI00341B65B6
MVDLYQDSGEFLDVMSLGAWMALREPVRQALAGVASSSDPIVDLGAGSGLGVAVAAEVAPHVEILAVEPSPVQRAALHARLGMAADLMRRVTVVAGGAERFGLPDRIGAVLAINMIGHLAPAERRGLWRRLVGRLSDGAPLVVNLQPPAEPVAIAETVFGTVQVGRLRYEGSGSVEPAGADVVMWHMRYRVLDEGGDPVREFTADYPWHVLSVPQLVAELSAAGFLAQAGPLDVVRAVRA